MDEAQASVADFPRNVCAKPGLNPGPSSREGSDIRKGKTSFSALKEWNGMIRKRGFVNRRT
jgi:hypothetical protein